MVRSNKHSQINLDIAKLISDALANRGMYQKDLALGLGVSSARVSQMLNGQANFTMKSLSRIAGFLGLELSINLQGK